MSEPTTLTFTSKEESEIWQVAFKACVGAGSGAEYGAGRADAAVMAFRARQPLPEPPEGGAR